MSFSESMSVWRLAGLMMLVVIACFSTWRVQDWRYGKQLTDLTMAHQSDLVTISNAASAQAKAEQVKRLALEQQLATSDQQHLLKLSNAQRDQVRLRDRLATADVRLSVLLDATDTGSGCNVPSTPGAVGVVHATRRAQLDPAHAQRIIAITDDGDNAVIALRACQGYVRAITLK